MADGTTSITTEGGRTFFEHYYPYMDTGRSNLAVRAAAPAPPGRALAGGLAGAVSGKGRPPARAALRSHARPAAGVDVRPQCVAHTAHAAHAAGPGCSAGSVPRAAPA